MESLDGAEVETVEDWRATTVAENLIEELVVKEGPDGAEGNAAGLSRKEKRHHRTSGKDLNLRKRQLHRRRQQQLDRNPARDDSRRGTASAPRAEAGTGLIILPHGDR